VAGEAVDTAAAPGSISRPPKLLPVNDRRPPRAYPDLADPALRDMHIDLPQLDLARLVWPLAIMLYAGRVAIVSTHFKGRWPKLVLLILERILSPDRCRFVNCNVRFTAQSTRSRCPLGLKAHWDAGMECLRNRTKTPS
jgi:hypothetical protein